MRDNSYETGFTDFGSAGFDFPGFDGVGIPASFGATDRLFLPQAPGAGRDPIGLPDFDLPDRLPSPDDVFVSVSSGSATSDTGTTRSFFEAETSEGLALEIIARGFDGADVAIDGDLDGGFTVSADRARLVNDGIVDLAVPVVLRFTGERIKVVNEGTIAGEKTALSLDGAASIVNSGLIEGDIRLAGDAGSYEGRDGALLGVLFGSGFGDVARGGDLVDNFRGRGGDDRLSGGKGADILRGNGGEDRVFGGKGADLITGGRGDDILGGGAGRDTFVFTERDGDDVIRDFGDGRDRLDLTGFDFGSAAEVRALATQDGSDLVIDLAEAGGGSIRLEDVSRSGFGADDLLL